MSNVNTVTVSGNLTRDIELRKTQSDFTIGNLGLAVERSKKVGDDWETETSFFDVTVFGGTAEFVAKKLRKGDLVTVSGRLEQQRWETDSGDKRAKVVIIASAIDATGLFRPKDEDNQLTFDGGGSSEPAAAAKQDDDIPF